MPEPKLHYPSPDTPGNPICRWKYIWSDRTYLMTDVKEDVTCKTCIKLYYPLYQVHNPSVQKPLLLETQVL